MNENPELEATDATHKTNWQGYPCILMGTTDLSKHFHPFGLMLSYKEGHKDFRFAFKTLANLCRKINGYDYFPSHLLADNCDAIIKVFRKQFGSLPVRRIVCWAHAIRS